MKKVVAYTIADSKNEGYAKMLRTSFKKFHKDIDFVIFGEKEINETGIPREVLFYLATPYFGQRLLKDYEMIIKIDSDSIVTGYFDQILDDPLYDVAVVLNWNRIDPATYGEIGLATISPREYFNNGLVATKNKDFINEWVGLCRGIHFNRMPMREQGFLNILTHYGRFQVKVLDHSNSWWGLVSKGEWNKCILKDGKIILPKGADNYPAEDKEIKCIHWGGGNSLVKMNYKSYFNDEVSTYIDGLIKE